MHVCCAKKRRQSRRQEGATLAGDVELAQGKGGRSREVSRIASCVTPSANCFSSRKGMAPCLPHTHGRSPNSGSASSERFDLKSSTVQSRLGSREATDQMKYRAFAVLHDRGVVDRCERLADFRALRGDVGLRPDSAIPQVLTNLSSLVGFWVEWQTVVATRGQRGRAWLRATPFWSKRELWRLGDC
jgi:hypothetical protein